MAYPKKRTPTPRHKRPAQSLKKAGGSWGDQLRGRLLKLQRKAGGSNNKFGALVGVDPRRVGQWLSGDVLPGADNLKAIAQGTGASLDWVFFGTDAAGKPTSEIQKRGQWRDKPSLETDLAAHVAQEGIAKVSDGGKPWILAEIAEAISGEKLLQILVEIAAKQLSAEMADFHDQFRRIAANIIMALKREKLEKAMGKNDAAAIRAALKGADPPPTFPEGSIFSRESEISTPPKARRKRA